MTASLPAPPVAGSSPPTAATTGLEATPVAVAVAEGVRGPPVTTVTSGLAVAVGLGLGASTHLVTLTPLAAAVVVQKEPCAKAPDAGTRTVIKDNEANSSSLFTNPPLPIPPVVDPNLTELGTRINTNLDHCSHSFRSIPLRGRLVGMRGCTWAGFRFHAWAGRLGANVGPTPEGDGGRYDWSRTPGRMRDGLDIWKGGRRRRLSATTQDVV
jgi:hypothetical protein